MKPMALCLVLFGTPLQHNGLTDGRQVGSRCKVKVYEAASVAAAVLTCPVALC